MLKSEKQHLERVLKDVVKIEKCKDQLISESLIQKVAENLSSERVYDPSQYIECLVLESQANIRIRKKQFELIQKMLETTDEGIYHNLAIQLIMGGGKTSVLASILGLISAKKKRLSLFIVPSALYKSVKENLQKTQLENFGQELSPIDLERGKFSTENLKWIEKELQKAIKKQKMVLMKPEMIQSLCLEFIYLLDIYADSENKKNLEDLELKIETLRGILNIFRKQSDALGDEIDQLLTTLKAVNFPGGEELHVEKTRIDLIKEIYKIALDENEQIDFKGERRSLPDLIGLKTNKQTLLSEKDYRESVMPAIAQTLLYYKPIEKMLNGNKELIVSCHRYLCDKIDPKLQEFLDGNEDGIILTLEEEDDLSFLRFLRTLSSNENNKETVNLIALSRHILNDTLPGTLSKNGNRHYGRKSESNPKVVPYLGVGTPATTQFADHYRALCFHYQTAISEGICPYQVLEFAKASTTTAYQSAKKLHITFSETPEAIHFKKITGVDLHLIEKSGQLEKATSYINEEIDRILELESFTIANEVTFHSKRLNSTPHMFYDQFGSESSFRGFSGTIGNDSTFPEGLEVKLDQASNGKISDLFINREVPIHQVDSDDPAVILEKILKNHSTPKRIRGIIDAGGEFKKYENPQVASKILEKLDQFEAGLYFGKVEGQSTPDTLFMLKRGSKEPIPIYSTHLEAILAKGVSLDKIFFYYDERHTTGTDFVQIPNAINLITVGEKSSRRDVDQGAMRLRELFLHQEIEIVLNKESAKAFIGGGQKIEEILLTTLLNETIAKSDQTVHSFFEQLGNVPKRYALRDLLDVDKSLTEISKAYKEKNYKAVFFTEANDEPYQLYGSLREEVKTVACIKEKAQKLKKHHFENEKIVADIERIVQRAEQSLFLKETMMSPISEDFGQGEEIEICTEINTEQQSDQLRETQLEVDLQQELDFYNKKANNLKVRKETVWSEEQMLSVIKGNFSKSADLCANFSEYKKDYGKIFDPSKIFVTENFRLTYESPVSVFDKAQKPANQILLIKTKEGMRALLLSYYEAYQFGEYLFKLYQENLNKKEEERIEGIDSIWLCGTEGDLFLDNPFAKFNKKEKQIERLLLQINFFDGNINYLSEREQDVTKWFKENYALKSDYLKLKIEKDQRARTQWDQFKNKISQ